MGKLATSIALMSGIVLLFHFGGMINDTASTTLLNLVLNPEGLENNSFVTTLLSVLAVFVSVGSVFLAKNSNSDTYLLVPLVFILLSFVWDFLVIYNQLATIEIGRIIGAILFASFMIVYVMGVIEWWRGVES